MDVSAVQLVVLKMWETEESAGFPRLRRTPSTVVRKFLRFHAGLAESERPILQAALASRGTMAFGAQPGPLQGAQAGVRQICR